MTENEAHYAQIEKEMLSIVFAVEQFEPSMSMVGLLKCKQTTNR